MRTARALIRQRTHRFTRSATEPTLEKLVPYYRGVFFTTVALKKRVAGMESDGREASTEVDRYQALTNGYMEAIKEARKLRSNG